MSPVVSLQKTLISIGIVDESFDFSTLSSDTEGVIRQLARTIDRCERDILDQIADHLKLELIDLDHPDTLKRITPSSFTSDAESNLFWQNRVAPLWEKRDGGVVVGVTNPYDIEAQKAIEFALGSVLQVVLVEEAKLQRLLKEHFPAQQPQFDSIEEMEGADYVELVSEGQLEDVVDLEAADAPPIVRLVNKVIADAVAQRASDIHIEPRARSLEIRFRIDGVMHSILEIPKRLQPYVTSRIRIISGMDISERRRPQDGGLHVRVSSVPIDLRVSSLPTPHGEKIVLRLLRQDSQELTFSALGVEEPLERSLLRVLDKRGKMFLVTGPTGSGKTTFLYTALHYLHDGTRNIQTVEDPIEYEVSGVNQVQVNSAAGVTFASALRSVLRQDPDVIMIGEIRDGETADIALQAAQTGHFVLSTLHTNDAPSAVARLLNLGADPFLIASAVEGVVAQRLVRKLCPNCSTATNKAYLDKHRDFLRYFDYPEKLVMPVGCEECRQTGYIGRTGVYSYLPITSSIEDLIHQKASVGALEAAARKGNFTTIGEASVSLVNAGVTSIDEIAPYLSEEHTREQIHEPHREVFQEIQVDLSDPAQFELESSSTSSIGIERSRVLLVEDDDNIRAVLAMMLEREMYEVIEAENGQQALERVYESPPDVILCDLMMPIMDGKEFLTRMNRNPQTQAIPVLMLTAADTEENEVELIDLGAEDFVSKTASSEVVLSRLRRAMKGSPKKIS